MGLSASQGRLLLLTARRSDLEFRAQQISQKRLILSQQLEEISMEYEEATSNRQMKIDLYRMNADGEQEIDKTTNLTYADLISGTTSVTGPGSKISGIQRLDEYESDATAAVNYRLVSIDGAIVVSSAREIPNSTTTTDKTTTPATQEATNIYSSKRITKDSADSTGQSTETVDNGLFVVAPVTKNADGSVTKSDLAKALTGKQAASVDVKQGIVKLGDTYYHTATGAKLTDEELQDDNFVFNEQEATIVGDYNDVPKNEVITNTTTVTDVDDFQEGADGVYTIVGKDGVKQRYIVDPTLKFGSTDKNGSTAGPNYLQDCLRNGKYLLQKCIQDENVDEGWRWSNISWDATSDISDIYYTEDDEAAKAKYDRLQTQIQAQDKKLELELDNIETQRNAVTTEVESVEKVISEDIEGTFNAFG